MNESADDLEAEDTWDGDAAEALPAVHDPHVVLSLRFSSAEFERIGQAAEQEGLDTVAYVRRLVLQSVGP